MKTRTRLGLGFGGQVLLSAVLGIGMLAGLAGVESQFNFVAENEVPAIANARHLSKLVVDMETGQRGFCIVQKEEFLEPYIAGAKEFDLLIEREKELVSGDPNQVAALERIEHLVDDWKRNAAEPEIAMARRVAKRTVDAQHLQDVLGQGVGRELMAEIMALGHEIETSFSDRGDWEGAFAVEIIEKSMADREGGQRGFLITGKEEFLEKYTAGEQKDLPKYFAGLRAIVSERRLGDEWAEKVDRLEHLTNEWTRKAARPEIAARREMNENSSTLRDVSALLEARTGKALIDEIRREFDAFIAIEEELFAARYASATQTAATTRTVAISLVVLALCLGLGLAVVTNQAIATPLAELVSGAMRVGGGDLGTRVAIDSADEVGDLGRAFNAMTRSLEDASTKRVQAEQDLTESKEYSDNVIRSIIDTLIVIDPEGKVETVNQTTLDLLGYTENEIVGKHLTMLVDVKEENEEDAEGHQPLAHIPLFRGKKTSKLLTHGYVSNAEVEYIAKNERKIPVLLSGAVIRDRGGNVTSIVCIAKDISERRKSEEAIRTIQKLESLGVMAGGIAHDFNNILTGILGNLSLANEVISPGSELHELIVESQNACTSAKSLTSQLLTFAKGGSPVVKVVALGPVLEEVCIFAARGSGAKCLFVIDDDLQAARVDRNQLAQVLQNLVINASEAMPGGGAIKISASNVPSGAEEIATLEDQPYVKISIEDHGIGMSDAQTQKIFDPYFSTKVAGRGLGLATCHSIITKHGGHIGVQSTLEVGATFTVHLPAAARTDSSSESEPAAIKAGTGKVLIMDDEAIVARTLARMLKKLGYECETVSDGAQALAAYKKAKELGQGFHVVIMDLTIPGGMGGAEAITKLTRFDPEAKAIVSSGYSNDPTVSQYAKLGFAGILAKPYRLAEASDVLAEVLRGDSTA